MTTLRDIICTCILMIVVAYLSLIPLFRYVFVLLAVILVSMTLIVLALGFWNQLKELSADEEPAARQRSAEEIEALYNKLCSWKNNNARIEEIS